MKKVKIKNLRRPLCGEDEYYTGPSVREAALSMAQDIALIYEEMTVGSAFRMLEEGVDYVEVKTIKSLLMPAGIRVLYTGPTVEEAVMEMARDIIGARVGAIHPAVSSVAKALVEGVDYKVVEDEND
jgi:alkylation response protein AidB-like acyl-CoA dehydrogenase